MTELGEELATARETTGPKALTADAIVEWIVANVPAKVQKEIAARLTEPKPKPRRTFEEATRELAADLAPAFRR
jgi:hypothetical protein